MTKKVSKKSGLKVTKENIFRFKAITDMVLIEEDPITPEVDDTTGLTKSVVESIKDGKLIIPDTAQYALEKYPCRGTIISTGKECRHVKDGDRVMFARLGGQRMIEESKSFVAIRERDILAILG